MGGGGGGCALRILYVTQGFPPEGVGGVELHTEQLARAVAGAGHRVTVLHPARGPVAAPFETAPADSRGLELVRLRTRRPRLSFEGLYRNPRLERTFRELLARLRPDVVHVQSILGLSAGLLEVLTRRGIPWIMTLHDHFTVCPLGQRIRRDLELCETLDRERCARCLRPDPAAAARRAPWPRRPAAVLRALGERLLKAPSARALGRHDRWMRGVLSGARLLVTPSRFHRERFLEYGIRPDRIRVVENGLAPLAPREHVPDPDGRVRFAYVGLLLPTKGVHVAVEAFNRLERPGVSLEIHGNAVPYFGRTDYVERLRAAVRSSNPVRFHGRFAGGELGSILARADVLVVPSIWYEAFCLTAREGFQAGVPVLASRIGGLAEAFEEGRGGLFFEPGDAADLASKMERLAADEGLRREVAAGAPTVRTMEDCAREMIGLYREAIAR